MTHGDGAMTRRRHRGWWPATALALTAVLLAGCGNGGTPATTAGSLPTGSAPGGSEAGAGGTAAGAGGTATGTNAEAAATARAQGIVPFCTEVPALGPIREGNHPGNENPGMDLTNVVTAYGAERPDTFAGWWIDRDQGGTVVVAFTDDPAPHLTELLARAPRPGDAQAVQTAPPTVAVGGGAVPTTPAPPTTTVGESGWVVDVVQAPHSQAALTAVQSRLYADRDALGVTIGSSGTDVSRNRVRATVDPSDEATRRRLAERWPADQVCVERVPTADEAWPAGVPKPTTLIPPAGTEPWVTCGVGGGGLPFPASRLEHPEPLAPDDPLSEALRVGLASDPGLPPGATFDEFGVLARTDDQALLGMGSPPRGLVTFRRGEHRWVWSGSGGSCSTVRTLLPPGVRTVDWALDRSFPLPGPGDTEIHVLVNEVACNSGQPVGERLLPAEVSVRDGQMLIGFGAKVPTGLGGASCPSNPSTPVTVTLPEPLGDRVLADGTSWPPKPADQLSVMGVGPIS